MLNKNNQGFSLIEISMVLVVIGLMLGTFLGPLAQQVETRNIKETKQQLDDIKVAIVAFASIYGYIPCPTQASSGGAEIRDGDNNCSTVDGGGVVTQFGYVPYQTLGLSGARDSSDRLLDKFNNPINYIVSERNDDNNLTGSDQDVYDFTIKGTDADTTALDNVPMSTLAPIPSGTGACTIGGTLQSTNKPCAKENLTICKTESSCNDVTGSIIVATNIPFILHSNGKNLSQSDDEDENTDSNNYFVDKVYEKDEFDDILIWASSNELFASMLKAGQLP